MRKYLPLFLMILVNSNLSPAHGLPIDLASQLDSICEARVSDRQETPGLALVLTAGDQRFIASCGAADMASAEPVMDTTSFFAASLTKQFVALEVLLLADAGQIDLDAPIADYLPGFSPNASPSVRQLMQHSSGLYEHWYQWRLSDAPGETLADILALAATQDEREFTPGTRMVYTNLNYVLLAGLIEVVTGSDAAIAIQRDILDPLGMHHSGFAHIDAARTEDRAAGHVGESGNRQRLDHPVSSIIGDGGLYLSAQDMAAWLSAFDGRQFGPMLQARAQQRDDINGDPMGYGAGLHVGHLNGELALHHGGGSRGASAWMAYLPDQRIGVAVFANAEVDTMGIASAVLIAALGEANLAPVPVSGIVTPPSDQRYFVARLNDTPLLLELTWDEDGTLLMGASGSTMRPYTTTDNRIYLRQENPIIEFSALSNGDARLSVSGQFYAGFQAVQPSGDMTASPAGRWASAALPGAIWIISENGDGISVTGPRFEAAELSPVADNVYFLEAAGVFVVQTSATTLRFVSEDTGAITLHRRMN